MKTKNKIGPNTDPCGTPEVTDTWEDFHPPRQQSVIYLQGRLWSSEEHAHERHSGEA